MVETFAASVKLDPTSKRPPPDLGRVEVTVPTAKKSGWRRRQPLSIYCLGSSYGQLTLASEKQPAGSVNSTV